MVAITATNNLTPPTQAVLARARLEQARRQADEAEASAQTLRSDADAAEVEAQKSQQNVRNLLTNGRQIEATYASPVSSKKTEVPKKTQDFLVDMYTATSDKFAASGNPLKTDPKAPPIVNTQGQFTGRIVNVSA